MTTVDDIITWLAQFPNTAEVRIYGIAPNAVLVIVDKHSRVVAQMEVG